MRRIPLHAMPRRKKPAACTIDITIEGAQPDTCDVAVQRLLGFARQWEIAVSGPSAYRRVGDPIVATEQPLRQMRIHGRRVRLRAVNQEVIEAMRELQMPCALALDVTILAPKNRTARGVATSSH